MPHLHICLILDWDEIKKTMTELEYIDQYIQAEIPKFPDASDMSEEAVRQRQYHSRVTTLLCHTCMVGRCKEKETDPCSKRFPVCISSLFSSSQIVMYLFLQRIL